MNGRILTECSGLTSQKSRIPPKELLVDLAEDSVNQTEIRKDLIHWTRFNDILSLSYTLSTQTRIFL